MEIEGGCKKRYPRSFRSQNISGQVIKTISDLSRRQLCAKMVNVHHAIHQHLWYLFCTVVETFRKRSKDYFWKIGAYLQGNWIFCVKQQRFYLHYTCDQFLRRKKITKMKQKLWGKQVNLVLMGLQMRESGGGERC